MDFAIGAALCAMGYGLWQCVEREPSFEWAMAEAWGGALAVVLGVVAIAHGVMT